MTTVEITDRVGPPLPGEPLIRRAIDAAAARCGVPERLSVVFVDAAEMTALNRRHTGRDEATDVLAFPLDAETAQDGPLGEVIVCAELARERAGEGAIREALLYVVHGVLHLSGYDDGGGDAASMYEMEDAIVASVCEEEDS